MKKRICALLLCAVLLLTACGGGSPLTQSTAPELGVWNGNVFENEYLGLRLTLMDGWEAATDEEIAEMIGADRYEDEFWELVEAGMVIYDMMANSMVTGANIQIGYERLLLRRMSVADYLAIMAEEIEDSGMEVIETPGTTRIGAYEWYSIGSVVRMWGVNIYGRYFVNIEDGFARMIMIIYHEESESLEEIMAMFSSL